MWEDEMQMADFFQEKLQEVCDKYNCEWYKVIDSDLMDEVQERIADQYGTSVIESDEYQTWLKEMAEDL